MMLVRETGLEKKENPLREIYKQKQEYWTQEYSIRTKFFIMNQSDD